MIDARSASALTPVRRGPTVRSMLAGGFLEAHPLLAGVFVAAVVAAAALYVVKRLRSRGGALWLAALVLPLGVSACEIGRASCRERV